MSLTINFEVTAEHIAAGTPKYGDCCAVALALKASVEEKDPTP